MKIIFLISAFVISISISAQTFRYTAFNKITNENISPNTTKVNTTQLHYDVGLIDIPTAILAFTNSIEDTKKREEEIQKAQIKINQLKETYANATTYPEKIEDGWHLVMVTDHKNFCNSAKAFIKDNNISQLIIDNYMEHSLNFNPTSAIQNAKSKLDLKDSNDKITHSVDVYFMNDLETPTLVDAPLEAGYISFYSDMGSANSIKVVFNGFSAGLLKGKLKEDKANCYHENSTTFKLKPATYSYKAFGRGSINWSDKAIIQEGQCLLINLNQENRYGK